MKPMSPSLGAADTGHLLQGIHPSPDYKLAVNGRMVEVLSTATVLGGPASFASFTVTGKSLVVIETAHEIKSAKILPASYGMTPKISGNKIEFEIDRPGHPTVEINGTHSKAFHLFANPPETDIPSPTDPKVVYLGPGVHERQHIFLHDDETLYLAEGAILRPTLPAGVVIPADNREEVPKRLENFIQINNAKNVKVYGRGIIDLSPTPWHAFKALVIHNCSNVVIEGITMIDAPDWDIGINQSNNVVIRNVKQISPRENSDGIDISNSQDVLVENCFLRNNDDEICIKTLDPAPAQICRHIVVQNCIVWNERARGLGITSETRRDVDDVVFRNCDIIHDFSLTGPCATLAVLVGDSGRMTNIRFEDIRVEDVRHQLVLCWIGSDPWSKDEERGHIDGVTFKNITVGGEAFPASVLEGFDATHRVENVTFENVRIHGKLITDAKTGKISHNAFADPVRFV